MARTTVTAGTRIGIAALAALGAFALPLAAGAAQASTTPVAVAPVDCAALQAAYDGLEIQVEALQERLAEAPPAQKPALIKRIMLLSAQQTSLQQQMDAAGCP